MREEDVTYHVVERWEYPAVTCTPTSGCPYVGAFEESLTLTPRNESDWRRDLLQHAARRPRCVLMALPEHAVNLSVEDLKYWCVDAAQWMPDLSITLFRPGAKLPCGDQPFCMNHARAGRELFNQEVARWEAKAYSTPDKLKACFTGLSERAKDVVTTWAFERSKNGKARAITSKELVTIYKVDLRTIQRYLKEATEMYPEIMKQIRESRKERYKENKAYEVRT